MGGINEIKYPQRNNHASSDVFIHLDIDIRIKRGNARVTNTIGAVSKCLCINM